MGISLDDLVDLCKEFGFDVFPGSEGVRMIVLPGDLQQQRTMGNHVSFIFRGYNFWGLKSYFLPRFPFIFRGYNFWGLKSYFLPRFPFIFRGYNFWGLKSYFLPRFPFIFRGYNFWGLKSYFLPRFPFIFRGYNPYLLGFQNLHFWHGLLGFQGKRVFKIVRPKF